MTSLAMGGFVSSKMRLRLIIGSKLAKVAIFLLSANTGCHTSSKHKKSKMKLSVALLFFSRAITVTTGKIAGHQSVDLENKSVKADSKIGTKLLANSRRLENDEDVDSTWVVGYSLKFQGCHHVSQWNDEADEDDPKIQTKRLVRFRLCPTDTCSYGDAGGCGSGYGDYIVDMNTFLEAYMENRQEFEEWNCEYYENNVCYCENANNEEYCLYDCFLENNLEYCMDENPYQDDDNNDDEEEFEIDQYMECGQWDVPESDDDGGRRLEDDDEIEYFIGPYCSDQGGKIYLGLFTDEYCTNFYEDQSNGTETGEEFYYNAVGKALPYSSESLVGMDCVSCKERGENDGNDNDDNNNNNNQNEEENLLEFCDEIYQQAGKCESTLDDGVISYPNENACTYIEGIKIVREYGVVVQSGGTNSMTANVFLLFLGVAFVSVGAYVTYLRTKLDRVKVNLSMQ